MAEINKPSNINKIWAETGVSVKPADSKISQGWIPEIPPYEWMNWELNRQSAFASHINQHGLPMWDNETPYLINKSYVIGSDGNVYKSLSNNTNKDPISNPSDWVKAFDSAGDSYTKAESDGKYLVKANNLSDIPNAVTARTNLSVYSKAEVDQSKAALAGSTAVQFNVANASASTHAVSKSQLDALSTTITSLQSTITALQNEKKVRASGTKVVGDYGGGGIFTVDLGVVAPNTEYKVLYSIIDLSGNNNTIHCIHEKTLISFKVAIGEFSGANQNIVIDWVVIW